MIKISDILERHEEELKMIYNSRIKRYYIEEYEKMQYMFDKEWW